MEAILSRGNKVFVSLTAILALAVCSAVVTYRLKKSAQIKLWEKSLEAYSEKLEKEIKGRALCFDVSDNEAVMSAFNETGALDLLVNNAGISEIDLFTAISSETAEKILNTNLKGAMNCARAALKEMIKLKKGNIIKMLYYTPYKQFWIILKVTYRN